MITIRCHHLVCVKGEDGNDRHIVFKADTDSRNAIRAAVGSGTRHKLAVHDISGFHSSVRPRRVVAFQESYGTIIFTTE